MALSTEELKALYEDRQFERCWQEAHNALIGGSTDHWAFLLAGMCLLRLGRTQEFVHMFRSSGAHAAELGARCFSHLLQQEAYEALAPIGNLFAANEPLWLVADYFAGCALLMLGRQQEAMAHFKAFRLAWPRFLGKIDFIADDGLNVMLRQGRLVADPEEVARRMSIAARTPALEFIGGANMVGRPVIFASGNNHYFNTMAPAFVAGMVPYLPTLPGGGSALLHLHVIDPDAASVALIERLRAQHHDKLAFSLERAPLHRTFTYYSCSRFYVMTGILDRYRAPVVSFDIDIVPTVPIDRLFAVAEPFDFCCFRTRRNEPASVFQASVMYWPDKPGTRTFLDHLQRFCWEELRNPSRTSWMLDQAGLFSLLTDPVSTVKFGDYAQLTGQPLEQFVRITFSDEIKAELRHRVQQGEPTQVVQSGAGASAPG